MAAGQLGYMTVNRSCKTPNATATRHLSTTINRTVTVMYQWRRCHVPLATVMYQRRHWHVPLATVTYH